MRPYIIEKPNKYELELQKWQKDPDFIRRSIVFKIMQSILQKMDELKVSKTELAKRLNVKKPYINKIFDPEANFTISTIAKIAVALESNVEVDFVENYNAQREIDKWNQSQIRRYKSPSYTVPTNIEDTTDYRSTQQLHSDVFVSEDGLVYAPNDTEAKAEDNYAFA